ncbi:MAG: FAD-dependent oxidoreductase [Clostridia bacterium]|nr:FAD-dependent oxidoreductase [Clostridia bacterium]
MKKEKILYDLESQYGNWWQHGFASPKMTAKLYPYNTLFSPIKINNITIKNRIVMGPMGNINMAEETGRPNQMMISYLAERAKGGTGLITTGLIPISHGIDPTVTELGKLSYFPRIDRTRTVMSGWRELVQSVHAYDSKIFVQLTAGLGRVGNPQCLLTQLKLPASASWNPNFYIPQIPCARLCDRKLNKLVKNFGQASADAKAMGLDGVYLHGHEGYLLEQLTNPAFNRRKLGKYANWQKFGIKTVKEIRKRVGPKYPIMYRIDLSLALNSTYQEKLSKIKSLKKFKNERTIDQTLDYMRNLVAAGVDIFDVDLGCYDNWWLPHPPSSMPSGCFLEISKIVKDFFAKNRILSNMGLPVPVVAVGKLGYPDLAEKALRDEMCDMIMLARPLLADPEWPNKAYRGETKNIRPCIGCHEACIREFVEGGHPQCAVNPRTAFEDVFAQEIPVSPVQKRVAVVGAGPSGVVAAKTLLSRGHIVDLYEATDSIGGTLIPASVPKIKYELKNYVDYLALQVQQMQKNKHFTLLLNTTADATKLKRGKYDVIITATGSHIVEPKIKGIQYKNVATVTEVLSNPKLLKGKQKIVIIGGGDSGCETAYYLKYELGLDVEIIEMTPAVMAQSCTANRGHIMHYLQKAGVRIDNLTTVNEILPNGIVIDKNVSPTVPDPYNTWQPLLPENISNPLAPKIKQKIERLTIPADLVVIAIGTRPNNALYNELVAQNVAPEIYNIGDSITPGKVWPATKSAYRRARTI